MKGVQALGYSNALGAEWCGANADMITVVVDAAFDQIKVILTPPAMGVNFVPPFSEIATITVEYTALDGRRSSFGPDISAAYRADATFTEVEVITSASTEPPAPSSQTDGLSGGAVAGIVIAGVFVLAVVFLVGRTGRSKGTAYEKKPILG